MNQFLFPDVGNAGLGNMLFPWARAVVYKERHQQLLINPTWWRFRIGPYLRNENDKRRYHLLFQPGHNIHGLRKLVLLNRFPHIAEDAPPQTAGIRYFSGMLNKFDPLLGHHELIKNELLSIIRPRYQNQTQPFTEYIGLHIRRGDYHVTGHNEERLRNGQYAIIPLRWYIQVVTNLRSELGDSYPLVVFSDGNRTELSEILSLPNTQLSRGSAIEDILGLSKARYLVTSASTFSMWASFLGQRPTIWYPGQLKAMLNQNPHAQIEIDYNEVIPLPFFEADFVNT